MGRGQCIGIGTGIGRVRICMCTWLQVGCHRTEEADLAVPSLHQLPAWLWSEPASKAAHAAVPALEACCQEEVLVVS